MASELQARLAGLEGVPNRVPQYTLSQSADEVRVGVWCADAPGEPRVQVDGRAFGFVLDTYYLPLYLPDAVAPAVSVSRGSTADDPQWTVTLTKETARPFPGLEALQPEILPPEGIEALAQAGSKPSPAAPPRAKSGSGPSAAAEAASREMLARALQKENSTRSARQQPGLVLTSDDEMQVVDAHQEAEDRLLRTLRQEAALGSFGSTSSGAMAGHTDAGVLTATPSTTSRSGPRFGYGLAQACDNPLPPQLVQLSRVYELQACDPSALPLVQRDGMATAEENNKWDAEYYMNCMVDSDGQVASLVQCELCPPRSAGEVAVRAPCPVWPPESGTAGDEGWRTRVEYGAMLTSLLYAWAYDRRTTLEDPTVQSAWTISQLARPLTGLAPAAGAAISGPAHAPVPPVLLQHPLLPCLLASFRRSLTVPLHRSYTLSCAVLADVCAVLEARAPSVLAALAAVRHTFLSAAGDDAEDDKNDTAGTVLLDQDPFLLVYVRVALDPLIALLQSDHGATLVADTARQLRAHLNDEDWDPRRDTFKEQVGGLEQWDLLHLDCVLADALAEAS